MQPNWELFSLVLKKNCVPLCHIINPLSQKGCILQPSFQPNASPEVLVFFFFGGEGERNFALYVFRSLFLSYHKIHITIKQDSYSQANASDEESQKETMRLIDIGLP